MSTDGVQYGYLMDMPREARLSYFIGLPERAGPYASRLRWLPSRGVFPAADAARLSLPESLYFVVLLIGEARPTAVSALVCGAIAGPLLYLANTQWSVVSGGLVRGTAAYLIQGRVGRRDA
jgi:hypothetical protein